jgi:hypothetical protein
LSALREYLGSIAETPRSLSRTHSVKEMLERVEQTLKNAGIGNIIKGLSTYHTTPLHNNKTYDTLLRYNNIRSEYRSPGRDFLSELL